MGREEGIVYFFFSFSDSTTLVLFLIWDTALIMLIFYSPASLFSHYFNQTHQRTKEHVTRWE